LSISTAPSASRSRCVARRADPKAHESLICQDMLVEVPLTGLS